MSCHAIGGYPPPAAQLMSGKDHPLRVMLAQLSGDQFGRDQFIDRFPPKRGFSKLNPRNMRSNRRRRSARSSLINLSSMKTPHRFHTPAR